jgi:RNA polymerase sigma-70 factor (ECF subfamily)
VRGDGGRLLRAHRPGRPGGVTGVLRADLHALTDPQLVAVALTGDGDAFAVLTARHEARVLNFVTATYPATFGRADLEDIRQETWLRVWATLARFDGRCAFRTWATRIAVNLSTDLLRARRRSRLVGLEDAARVPLPNGERLAEAGALRRDLDAALATLTRKQRDVFLCAAADGWSLPQIAAREGLALPCVKSRHFAARRALQAALTRAAA